VLRLLLLLLLLPLLQQRWGMGLPRRCIHNCKPGHTVIIIIIIITIHNHHLLCRSSCLHFTGSGLPRVSVPPRKQQRPHAAGEASGLLHGAHHLPKGTE
jgi:hypothetical protein